MTAARKPAIYAVIGRPIGHSLSPVMYNAAFASLGINAIYLRVASGSAKDAVGTLTKMKAKGFNVTAPFKEDMLDIVDEMDPVAERTKAINTVTLKSGRLRGYSTDGYGVTESLRGNGLVLKGQRVCVLGAGGAARAAVLALVEAGAEVTVANRTLHKAEEIAEEFHCASSSLSREDLEKALDGCAAIVSCIDSQDSIVPRDLLRKGMTVLDGNYRAETALVRDARRMGCIVIGGRTWLLNQGITAFKIYTGKKAPAGVMRRALFDKAPSPAGKGVTLIGFMGSGKSTVSKELAKSLRMHAVDTDADVERAAGMSISDIFARHGESRFRELERERIARLPRGPPAVVAAGGGSVLNPDNVKALKGHGKVVLLWAGEKELERRLKGSNDRPLIAGGKGLKEMRRLLRERTEIYLASADIIVDAEFEPLKTAEVIANEARQA